jgi:hypothetical protein
MDRQAAMAPQLRSESRGALNQGTFQGYIDKSCLGNGPVEFYFGFHIKPDPMKMSLLGHLSPPRQKELRPIDFFLQ